LVKKELDSLSGGTLECHQYVDVIIVAKGLDSQTLSVLTADTN
jgi:hypothetical protein